MDSNENESSAFECPICGSSKLVEFNRRPLAMCAACKSFERTRLGWLVINKLVQNVPIRNIAHFAPEAGLARHLSTLAGSGYRAFDYSPELYQLDFVNVEQLDLCGNLETIAPASQDLVIHNHVLEHVPCNPWRVLKKIDNLLAPGGLHVFSVPVVKNYYSENLDPSLSKEARTTQFGQDDHMRVFGKRDVRSMLTEEFGQDVHFSRKVSLNEDELSRAGIPNSVLTEVSSHTVFVHQRVAGN